MANQPETNGDGRQPVKSIESYAMLEDDTKALYLKFYEQTYRKSSLDRKTKEFVAIAAALVTGCQHCLEGHLKKAIKWGATREEISETIAITLGVSAATIVDRSDIANFNLSEAGFPKPPAAPKAEVDAPAAAADTDPKPRRRR
ncbi:MAG: carboxymuconolactone decarboxylase family protein [Planctomycetes bacterium]|nr:carboxymuconolactone decarboxylase family protein [Planctomycetota bacterium]MBI3846841.1 carboxymuconolactone decarboxylase family protein [Planctomycetota bacterium]